MSTEINTVGNSHVNINAQKVDNAKEQPSTSAAEKEAAKKPEVVSISELSQQINQISESLKGADAVDETKVAEIKAAIENGSYKIDSMSIAKKFVEIEMKSEKAE